MRVATITFKPADHAANERHRDQTVAMRRQVGHGAASLSDVDQSVAKSSVFGECGYDHSDIRGYGARRQPIERFGLGFEAADVSADRAQNWTT